MSGVSHSVFFFYYFTASLQESASHFCWNLWRLLLSVFSAHHQEVLWFIFFFVNGSFAYFPRRTSNSSASDRCQHTVPPEHLHNEPEEAHPEETFARTGSEYSPHCHVNIASSILLGLPHLKGRPRKHKRHRLHITYHCVRKEVRAELTFTSSIISCVGLLHSECRWCHLWSCVYFWLFFLKTVVDIDQSWRSVRVLPKRPRNQQHAHAPSSPRCDTHRLRCCAAKKHTHTHTSKDPFLTSAAQSRRPQRVNPLPIQKGRNPPLAPFFDLLGSLDCFFPVFLSSCRQPTASLSVAHPYMENPPEREEEEGVERERERDGVRLGFSSGAWVGCCRSGASIRGEEWEAGGGSRRREEPRPDG